MSFPKYPAYKDSGVEWLGQVPTHWTIKSIKWLSPVLRGASPRPIDDPKYFDDDGEYAWVRIADSSASSGVLTETTQRLSELGSSLSVRLEPGALFVSIAGTVGKPCITAMKACIHDGFVYFPRLRIDPKFLFRVFEAGVCYAGLGKMGTQLNLNTDTIGSIRVALPPPDELPDVLSFIDRETTKIDALVAEQEQLITLLKEKRQAVISHAVTKGLDPSVPMKDSGVEWLGEVPKHWSVQPLGTLSRAIQTGPFGSQLHSDEYVDDATPVINPSNIIDGQLCPEPSATVTDVVAERLSHHKLVAGDIVVGRRGEMGRCAVVLQSQVGWLCGTGCLKIQLNPTAFPEFVWRYLSTEIVKQYLSLQSVGSTMENLNTQILARVPVPVPPASEQAAICKAVSDELILMSALESEAIAGVELLQERRSALISAAVTGQIDVRGLAHQEAA